MGGNKQCRECVTIRERREKTRNTDGDEFCPRHQCPYLDAQGIKCTHRKSKTKKYCSKNHCSKPQCPNQADDQTHLCIIHSCRYQGCTNSVDGRKRQIYCFELHKCSKKDCQNIREPILTDRDDEFRGHCTYHECQNKSCSACKIEGKDHCAVHYCKENSCRNECHSGLPKQNCCLHHYEMEIEAEGKKKGVAEERTRYQGEDARLRRELTRLREDNQRIREEGRQQGIAEERARFQEEHARLQEELTWLRENNLRIKEEGRREGAADERARVQEEHGRLQEEHARLQKELARLQKELTRVPGRFRREGLYPDHGYASQPDSESDSRYRGH